MLWHACTHTHDYILSRVYKLLILNCVVHVFNSAHNLEIRFLSILEIATFIRMYIVQISGLCKTCKYVCMYVCMYTYTHNTRPQILLLCTSHHWGHRGFPSLEQKKAITRRQARQEGGGNTHTELHQTHQRVEIRVTLPLNHTLLLSPSTTFTLQLVLQTH